ncbi:hypothetical protein ACJMK2_015879 [Sinanodonta woodiana]|uniref:FAD dependent oxidoreductase domain-containing protein n=1 Tax=Sinanodonta woodiana TaxID=1069815 RepID=A0ABD3USS7_SINWO
MAAENSEGRTFYDYIVIGCGGIGSGALYWLSKRAKGGVLGLEQFKLGHDNGGSQDHSRIIRLTYHDPMYTKLTPDTYTCWEEVERESGLKVLYKTGSLQVARKGEMDDLIKKYADSMKKENIDYEWLTGSQLRQRFPQFTTDDRYIALYQKDGGLVDAALCNAVHTQLARGNGATIIENCPVTRLEKDQQGNICVHTTKGKFYCRKVIVTSGAWINQVLSSTGVHVPVYVTQEQVTYHATPHMKDFTKDKYPIWFFHDPKYDFYMMPINNNSGPKIGIDAAGPVVTANTRTFEPDPVRERACEELYKELVPKALGPKLYTKTCLYDITPDRNFVVDTCEKYGWKNLIVCCGAGHAFKFASLLGKILSEMAIDGQTQYDISHFNIDRQALTDPNYEPIFYYGTDKKAFDKTHQKAKL